MLPSFLPISPSFSHTTTILSSIMSSSLKRKAATTDGDNSFKKARSITSFFAPQRSASSSGSKGSAGATVLPKFDKQNWVSTLTPEQKKLLALEIETMHDSWLGVLKDELVSDGFLSLKRFLASETATVYPPRNEIYSWSRYCPLDTVKVVILGQDPYRTVTLIPLPAGLGC